MNSVPPPVGARFWRGVATWLPATLSLWWALVEGVRALVAGG